MPMLAALAKGMAPRDNQFPSDVVTLRKLMGAMPSWSEAKRSEEWACSDSSQYPRISPSTLPTTPASSPRRNGLGA